MQQGLAWARGAVLAAGLVVAFGLHALVGLGLITAAGIPATAIMAAGLVFHRRARPAGGPTGWDPCLLLTVGAGWLALTSAGILPGPDGTGAGLAPLGLGAYLPLIIGLLRLQSARLPEREADVLVEAGLSGA